MSQRAGGSYLFRLALAISTGRTIFSHVLDKAEFAPVDGHGGDQREDG